MLTIISDLLLTDSFLIKGQIENKYTRLSQLLDEYRRYFIRVRDATLVDLNTRERILTPYVHVNVDEVLLAASPSAPPGRRNPRYCLQRNERH